MGAYPPKMTEDAALVTAGYAMQHPMMPVCTGTPASTRDCMSKRLSDACSGSRGAKGENYYSTYDPSAVSQDGRGGTNPFLTPAHATGVFDSWCRPVTEEEDTSKVVTTKAGMAALCYERLQYELKNPYSTLDCDVTQCYCHDFVFPPNEEQYTFSTGEDPETETVPDPTNPTKTLSSSISTDNTDITETSVYGYGEVIPQIFGSVIVGGTLLWVDTPYRVPYVAYAAPVYVTDEKGNVSGSTGLTKKYDVRTNILVGLAVKQTAPLTVKSCKIGDKYIPVANTEVLSDVVTHVHNGDFNSLHYTPAYRDLVVVRITDVPVMSFTDISLEVAVDATPLSITPVQTAAVIPPAAGLVRVVNNTLQFYTDETIVTVAAQYPNQSNPLAHTFPAEVTFEPAWWTTSGEVLIYHFGGALYKYNTMTGEKTLLNTLAATTSIAYLRTPDVVVFFDSNTQRVYNGAVYSTYTGTVNKTFDNGWYADMFDFAARVVLRVIPEELGVSQFSLRAHTILDVAQTNTTYFVFCPDGLYTYKRSDLSFVSFIPLPLSTVPQLLPNASVGGRYAVHLGSQIALFDADRDTVTLHPCPSLTVVRQVYYASALMCVTSTGAVATYSVHSPSATTNEVNVGELLQTLEYPYPTGYDLRINGYVVQTPTAAIDDLVTLFMLPHNNIGDAVVLDNYVSDVVVTHKTDFYDAIKLSYLKGSRYSSAADSASVIFSGDNGTIREVAEINTAAYLTQQQANEIASNLYANAQVVNTTLSIVSKELLLDVGDVILYHNQLFRITAFVVDGYTKYSAVGMTVDYVPYVYTPETTAHTTLPVWDFTGTTLFTLPTNLGVRKRHFVGYIGETPDLILVEDETRTALPVAAPVTTMGILISTPTFRLQRRIIDNTSEITVQFNAAQTGITTAEYAALVDDPYLNLLVVGNEAVQFTNYTTADNKTFTFTGLLRGRFGTEFFENFHTLGERVFLYIKEQWSAYTPTKSGHMLLTSASDSGTYVYNWHNEYAGVVNVTDVSVDTSGVLIQVANAARIRTRVSFAAKPIIWQKTKKYLASYVVSSDSVERYDFPPEVARHQYLYWMAEADGMFPEYGVVGKAHQFKVARAYTYGAYTAIAPSNTSKINKQLGYVALHG